MYQDQYVPFYAAYSGDARRNCGREQEEEFRLMKSYFPETAGKLQEMVEEECQLLDYEGSRIYDEYPDRFMLSRVCMRIREQAAPRLGFREEQAELLDELIQVLLYQEIAGRRCAGRRYRDYF